MKLPPILAVLLAFTACSHTEIRSANGKALFHTQADIAGLDYSYRSGSETIHMSAVSVNHSGPTLAGGTAVAKGIQSTGTAAVAVGTAIATSGLTGAAR